MIFIRKHDQLSRLERLGCTRIRTVVILGSVASRARLAGGVVLDYSSTSMSARAHLCRRQKPRNEDEITLDLDLDPSLASSAA